MCDRLTGAEYSRTSWREGNSCPPRSACPVPRPDGLDPGRASRGLPMELFTQLFGDLLAFVSTVSTALSFTVTQPGCRGPSRLCTSAVRIVGVSMVSKRS